MYICWKYVLKIFIILLDDVPIIIQYVSRESYRNIKMNYQGIENPPSQEISMLFLNLRAIIESRNKHSKIFSQNINA